MSALNDTPVDTLSFEAARDELVKVVSELEQGAPTLEQSRAHHASVMVSLPWEGLALSEGDPAIPVRVVPPGALPGA